MAAFLRSVLAALWYHSESKTSGLKVTLGFQAWLRAVLRNHAGDGAVSWVTFMDGCHFLTGG